jgi:hypothetical protein
VARGGSEAFPPIYFSIDGDGTLGEHALERLVDRLTTPYRWSGQLRRVVASKPCIRPDLFWQGWSLASFYSFFTVEGQLYRQVAREFLLGNVSRLNWKPLFLRMTIPGGLYCTWSELLVQAPRFMGFLHTVCLRDWLLWWLGRPPPSFDESTAPPLPEALTGPSDDTCISFLAQMSTWRGARLTIEAPRTPLHALGRLIRAYFWERTVDYAPEARVFTYTPTAIKALWIQRVRWNSSRFECSYRFKNALAFHWQVGFPMALQWISIPQIFHGALYYLVLPYLLVGRVGLLLALLMGYFAQALIVAFYTLMALMVERQWRSFWPVLFAVPLAPVYLSINLLSSTWGISKDLFFFGNATKFAPEWTFEKGKTVRFALLFRVRRLLALSVRALVIGDVPLGSFWLGWRETSWTPNGYEGWTTGKRRRIVPPVSEWRRLRNACRAEGNR